MTLADDALGLDKQELCRQVLHAGYRLTMLEREQGHDSVVFQSRLREFGQMWRHLSLTRDPQEFISDIVHPRV